MPPSDEKKAEEANVAIVAERSCSMAPEPEKPLTALEKRFLMLVERGDCASAKAHIAENVGDLEAFDINCKDPLDRSALISAIENENFEMIMILLDANVQVKDSLLHAIKEEYVEGVEVLLEHEEKIHVKGTPYSWEAVDRSQSTFTPDITPLILAAHMNNYEIIKILLDRGATLPMPHDVKCGCDACISAVDHDSLRHSQARINAYRALSSPSLIALSSRDPILTAFELSWELRKLARMETEFSDEYNEMRKQVQEFSRSLLDHARTSAELDTVLNHNPDHENWVPSERAKLERLKLAIDYRQKDFVSHPSVQQLLTTMWYDGLPGFRRLEFIAQIINVSKMAASFPINSIMCKLSPKCNVAKQMEKPFVKFINHSASYLVFLMLLGAASQRIEYLAIELFGNEWLQEILRDWKRRERGSLPGIFECGIIIYVFSFIFEEIMALWEGGLLVYISDLWNIVDLISNTFYLTWIGLRCTSYFISWREYWNGWDPYYLRENWDSFDPMLLSEGMFAAAMIVSFLKLVHIFSVNPHLGPLQISLGRMIIDIIKFFFIYTLVLFAFGCGMNKLLWYYADLEMHNCYHLPSGVADFEENEMACTIWRRFSNLFETSQSLFWASFGMVDLMAFEMKGVKSFTRFWALLMFGSYSVINVIVLLNMLIAMMSNSYQIISEHSDTEWKFARSKLWMQYFEEGSSIPAPFNIMPGMDLVSFLCGGEKKPRASIMARNFEKAQERHDTVCRLLVRRFVTSEQRKRDDFGITEDDIMEVRQDISTLRFELVDIFKTNGMQTPDIDKSDLAGKKKRVMERRLKQDFKIDCVEGVVSAAISSEKDPKDMFGRIAKAMKNKRKSTIRGGPVEGSEPKKEDWNAIAKRRDSMHDPIGSIKQRERRRTSQIKRNIVPESNVDVEKFLKEHPNLQEMEPNARMAYMKFKTRKLQRLQKPRDQFIEEDSQDKKANNSQDAKQGAASSNKVAAATKGASLKDLSHKVTTNVINETSSEAQSSANAKPTTSNTKPATDKPKTDKPKTDKPAVSNEKPKPEAEKPTSKNEVPQSIPPPPESKSRRRSAPRANVSDPASEKASAPNASDPPKEKAAPAAAKPSKAETPAVPAKLQYSSELEPGKGKSIISGKMIQGWI